MNTIKRCLGVLLLILLACRYDGAAAVREFSAAGFYPLEGTGRTVRSLNPAWRFAKDPEGRFSEAFRPDFDDSAWSVVSLPNGLELLPEEASGGVNYTGGAWYRKRFVLPEELVGKRLLLHFEAIMGKSKVWVNGVQVAEHYGGFLPVVCEVSQQLAADRENVIAVWCDNSNDPSYPPGKPQEMLDFCYFGGIYRDCWLVATDPETYITDANMPGNDRGGVFVTCDEVSEQRAVLGLHADVAGRGRVEYTLRNPEGVAVGRTSGDRLVVEHPSLWSPETPNLYRLEIRIKNRAGRVVDGYMLRIGIRSLSFDPHQGFILNGRPYPRKLMGANRHQDFAVVGNALSNNLHWRDVKKLKEAGLEVVRNAHYPQDPAFMDACDELGMFVIVNTPGWQFWNEKDPRFEQRVYDDIRQMVRRDRNHACVLMWEPILNETWYPDDFARNVHNLVKTELPGACTVSDSHAKGSSCFDIQYSHPNGELDSTRVYFTREYGDNVDDWNSHNSSSRVAREWGEIPQLIQAFHYADPDYPFTSIETINRAPRRLFGATLWHSFDHQRGYHPDPFYGGLMSAFRRPKISWYMYRAQADFMEPMVYIAHEMTPFSPANVTVLSNCPRVRLHTFVGDSIREQPHEGRWFTFEKAYDFMAHKALARSGRHAESYLLAEGLDNAGRVVATHRRAMSLRPARLELTVDTLGAAPVADGGDLVVIVASMVDAQGTVKRLNNALVRFEIEGEGRLLATERLQTNPVRMKWGEACVLVQTTTHPGRVTVRASLLLSGDNTPLGGSVSFDTHPAPYEMVYSGEELQALSPVEDLQARNTISEAEQLRIQEEVRNDLLNRLKEVEQQQEAFGEKRDTVAR